MQPAKKRGADRVIADISKKLSQGELKPGDKLPTEGQLCEDFGVSRTVIREAIQQLKAIGVIQTIVGSGSYVTEGSLDAMKSSLEFFTIMTGDTNSWLEMLDLRILLESACAKEVAGEKFSTEGLAKIQKALDRMQKSKHHIKAFAQADVDFHKTLIQSSNNKMFAAVLQSLENLQLRFSIETYKEENGEHLVNKNFNEHKAIVEAIEARDPETAETKMQEHLAATRLNLLKYIKNT